MATTATVTGFFYQSSGNIVEVIGKLIRRYMIQGVLPMFEVETSNGRMHVEVANATLEIAPFNDGGPELEDIEASRYTTVHPTTGELVKIPTHKGKRDGIKFATWIRFDVEGKADAAEFNNGDWMLMGVSKASNAKAAAKNSRSTNPYGAGYMATPVTDTWI
jgi:hypothetical protein